MANYCSNCGHKIQDDFKICPYCAKNVKEPSELIESKELKLEDNPIEPTDNKSKDKIKKVVNMVIIFFISFIVVFGVSYFIDWDDYGIFDSKEPYQLDTSSSHQIYREFEWDYPHDNWNKKTWTWELYFSRDLYIYKSQLPRLFSYENWAEYTVDATVTSLANGLEKVAEEEGFDDYETVSFILAFVQSLPYTEDDVTTGFDDYPRYPIETLVDGGGDCEDTSFLFAGILKELNYGVCLINPPNHVAVGVLGSETLTGTYYELDGKRYYYCETTGSGWEIGDCPDEYLDESAKLIKL